MAATQPHNVPGGYLRAALLLLLRERPDHGYDLHARLAGLGIETDSGVVYRALRQMEHDGLVSSAWAASCSGPARRSYGLTFPGEDLLDALATDIRHRRDVIDDFLLRHHATLPVTSR